TGGGEQAGGGPRGGQRRGRDGVPELLGKQDQLDRPEVAQLGPAELGHLLPLGVREPTLLLEREPPHLVPRVAGREELARGALDVALVVGELEVHARGSPRTRSATMFLRISVVPPSIELARDRRKR